MENALGSVEKCQMLFRVLDEITEKIIAKEPKPSTCDASVSMSFTAR